MTQTQASRELAERVVMMPRDADEQGKITEGTILSYIDLAAAVVARRVCKNPYIKKMVTRAIDDVDFEKPVHIKDVISCYGTVLRTGRTSVTVLVEVEADRAGEIIEITKATAVFVALGSDDRPTPLINEEEPAASQPAPTKAAVMITAPTTKAPLAGAERLLALRKVMMPYELNGMGNIFGGQLMTFMADAGSYTASRMCKNKFITRCAGRKMNKMEFKEPVNVNDLITCYGTVTEIGASSIRVRVEAEVERNGKIIPVTQADFIYVALNKNDKPVRVGPCKAVCPKKKVNAKGKKPGCSHSKNDKKPKRSTRRTK